MPTATTDPTHESGMALYVPRLARETEPCANCGALLASDQRYCLSCGERRADTRVPFPRRPRARARRAPRRADPG